MLQASGWMALSAPEFANFWFPDGFNGVGSAAFYPMAYKRQAVDRIGLIAQLAGFLVLISLFSSAVRRTLTGPGLGTLAIVAVGLLGFGAYRLVAGKRGAKETNRNPFATPTEGSNRAWNNDKSETTLDLLNSPFRRNCSERR
jgi:apolipoprotein N-acyltransferase